MAALALLADAVPCAQVGVGDLCVFFICKLQWIQPVLVKHLHRRFSWLHPTRLLRFLHLRVHGVAQNLEHIGVVPVTDYVQWCVAFLILDEYELRAGLANYATDLCVTPFGAYVQ